MSETYPKRPKFWANRVMRLLHKSCAANEIGIEACWLVSVIVQVEDSKRYTGAVTFWTGQLLPVAGFNSWDRLDRARKKAVESGWLHYRKGTKTRAAEYWATVPDDVLKTYDDSPVDEIDPRNADSLEIDPQNTDANADPSLIHPGSKHGYSIPTPNPVPISCPNRFADSDMQTAEFILKLILDMQPGRKRPDLHKWANTVRLMRERDNRTDAQIRELFGWCNQDPFWRTNVLSPEKLRQKWDDLQLRRGEGVPDSGHDDWPIVLEVVRTKYSPDIRNNADVQTALTPEQFAAAQSIGLKRIANADKFDKTTAEAYRNARKAVA